MVRLMQKDARQEIFQFNRVLLIIEIRKRGRDLFGPFDRHIHAGDAQAPFIQGLGTGLMDDLGVDDRHGPIADIGDKDPLIDAHLRGGQPYAFMLIHGVEHGFDQDPLTRTDVLDGEGFLGENGIAVETDLELGRLHRVLCVGAGPRARPIERATTGGCPYDFFLILLSSSK